MVTNDFQIFDQEREISSFKTVLIIQASLIETKGEFVQAEKYYSEGKCIYTVTKSFCKL